MLNYLTRYLLATNPWLGTSDLMLKKDKSANTESMLSTFQIYAAIEHHNKSNFDDLFQ